jgi:hypothetical protein
MEVAIVPEAVSSLADHEEASCRECNRETHDATVLLLIVREPYASLSNFLRTKGNVFDN